MKEPSADASDEDYAKWQQWLLGSRLHELSVQLEVNLAALNGHNRMDAADHVAVALNRLQNAVEILGFEPPPISET